MDTTPKIELKISKDKQTMKRMPVRKSQTIQKSVRDFGEMGRPWTRTGRFMERAAFALGVSSAPAIRCVTADVKSPLNEPPSDSVIHWHAACETNASHFFLGKFGGDVKTCGAVDYDKEATTGRQKAPNTHTNTNNLGDFLPYE